MCAVNNLGIVSICYLEIRLFTLRTTEDQEEKLADDLRTRELFRDLYGVGFGTIHDLCFLTFRVIDLLRKR